MHTPSLLNLLQPLNPPTPTTPATPERSLLYRTAAEHFKTWLELNSAGQFDGQCPS